MKIYSGLVFIILNVFCNYVFAERIHVAVASNFRQCMQELVTEFEKQSEHELVLSFGSSGKFYAQIKHGAPYDLFFSADEVKPIKLEKEGLGISGSRFTYAIGRLVLMGNVKQSTNKMRERLIENHFNKLAVANPLLAPYGVASLEVLDHLNIQKSTLTKRVIGENIAQTYQFVDSGNAELGFVALSQVSNQKSKEGMFWLIPDNWHKPILQQAILLERAKNKAAAKSFIAYMASDKAQQILNNYGYSSAKEIRL